MDSSLGLAGGPQHAALDAASPDRPAGRRWTVDGAQFDPVQPWPLAGAEDCIFYHSMDLPDGETLSGAWDIRGRFDSYIGHYPIAGKSVLDIGTASGFLTFEAEKMGATVTSLDARTALEFTQVPAQGSHFHENRAQFLDGTDHHLWMLRNGYWYAWHKLNSRAEVVYARLPDLAFWDRRFDVVIAGAITEHLSDPVTAIGNIARLAREAVIIAFDPVVDSDEMTLTAGANWTDPKPEHLFTWFMISRGLYRQLFANLGFDVEFVESHAIPIWAGSTKAVKRTTVIARRRAVGQGDARPRARPEPIPQARLFRRPRAASFLGWCRPADWVKASTRAVSRALSRETTSNHGQETPEAVAAAERPAAPPGPSDPPGGRRQGA